MAETKNKVATEEVENKETEVKKTTKKASSKKTTGTKKTTTTKKASKKEVEEVSANKTKTSKKAKKVEEVEAPARTEAKAKVLGLKVTPRKVRLVIDLVRGKKVDEAVALLSLVHKEAAPYIIKLINSAKANAVNNFNMNEENLYIAEIMASDSIKMRRYLPRAKGSASGMVKRFSNVYVTLKEKI